MIFIDRFPRLILSLIAAVALLPGIFQLPLMDRDEPRFSHATIEMMDRGEWVVPYFNDEYRFDKPPLTYWWMRLHYSVFGKHEFSARLHSTFSAWLIALVIFTMAGRIGLSRDKAVLAGAMWLCSFQVLIHGRMAVADMPLILCLVLSQWAQWEMLTKRDGKIFTRWFWLFHLSVGIGFLAKGPLAYAIPLITLLVYTLISLVRRSGDLPACLKTLGCTLLGVPLSAAIVVAWGLPAMLKTDWQYYDVGIGTHVVERATSSMNNRKVVYWIYLIYMFPFLLPWSAQLTRVLHEGGVQQKLTRASNYLLAWFISSFLIFSFMKTQLPHYILPGYPAFVLILAGLIGTSYRRSFMGKILGILIISVAFLISLTMILACVITPTEGEVAPMKWLFLSLAALFLFTGAAATQVYRNGTFSGWRAVGFSLLASLMMIPAGYHLRKAHATVKLMDHLSPDRATSRAAWGFQEGTLIWYPSDFWVLGSPEKTEGFAEADEMIFQTKRWRVDDDFLNALMQRTTPAPTDDKTERVEGYLEKFGVTEVARVQGFNPGNTSWVEIVIARREKSVTE